MTAANSQQRKQFLVSLGGQIYLPNIVDGIMVSIAGPGTKYEIVDTPFVTGREYDQTRFTCRKTAENLVERNPDMWKIVDSSEVTV
jgi:hypothetical protein